MKKKKLWIIVLAMAFCAAVMLWIGTGSQKRENSAVKLQTKFGILEFPREYAENLKHIEVEETGAIIEVFSMISGEEKFELFRIYFGEVSDGSIVGYIYSDSAVLPVTVVLDDSRTYEFSNEESETQYYSMMEGLNVVLSSLYGNEKFVKDGFNAQKESAMKLTYWNVTLPNTMAVSESSVDGIYEAVFSGEVLGESVSLYRISIGEEKEEVPLGYFKLDGVKKAVHVQSYDLGERDTWSEDDYAAAYRMMDTINDVINVIMQSKQFSAEAE